MGHPAAGQVNECNRLVSPVTHEESGNLLLIGVDFGWIMKRLILHSLLLLSVF
jgi:hypothetical protein